MCRDIVAHTAELGKTILLQALIDRGSFSAAVDHTGRSVLQLALGAGKTACVELLMFHGAQLNAAASETLMGVRLISYLKVRLIREASCLKYSWHTDSRHRCGFNDRL